MPNYVYECLDCIKSSSVPVEEMCQEQLEQDILYEARHSMDPSKDELYKACECPRCGSHNAKRVYYGYDITTYTRGYGFLDKAGARRDMNMYKLTTDDPYGQYREAGEVDDIKDRLQRGGKHNPKSKHFVQNISEKDVQKVTDKPN